ncbi:MAG TPA: DUF2878 domain-containing protein [Rudaea sp.]|nr:DUF2878 domain-containing protein [Rudaea sp.]
MNRWINAIFYQLTWVAAVAGAGHELWWAGPLALAIFACWQLSVSTQRRADVVLLACAAAIGFAIDSSLAQTKVFSYAAAVPWPQLAPIWIVALWMSFALTLNHCLAYLKAHLIVAAALGAIGAPLAYWAAASTWGAIHFVAAPSTALVVLAVIWAILTPTLCWLANWLAVPDLESANLQGVRT